MQSLWMIFAALFFSASNLTIKLSTDLVSPAQNLFFRGIIATVCVLTWCVFKRHSLRTKHIKTHFFRCISGVGAIGLYTYILAFLPMVTAVTMNYTAPVWLAIFMIVVALIKRTKIPSIAMLVCVFMSMVGVVLLLKPAFSAGQGLLAGLGLLSGFLSAIAYWQIKSFKSKGEPTIRIVFYHSSSIMVAGLLWWLLTPQALEIRAIPWLVATGVFAMAGQLSMTHALSKGNALFTSSLMYLTVVFSAIFGALFTNDGTAIDWAGYLGVTMIVSCSITATALSSKKAK